MSGERFYEISCKGRSPIKVRSKKDRMHLFFNFTHGEVEKELSVNIGGMGIKNDVQARHYLAIKLFVANDEMETARQRRFSGGVGITYEHQAVSLGISLREVPE